MSLAGGAGRFRFEAIGTAWHIDTPAELPTEVRAGVLNLIDEYDAGYSFVPLGTAVPA